MESKSSNSDIMSEQNSVNEENMEDNSFEDREIEHYAPPKTNQRKEFQKNILKLREENLEEEQNSFDQNVSPYSLSYFGNYNHYSLIDCPFNHFKDFNIERKPGQIVYLYISDDETDYREHNLKLIYKLK